MYKDRGSITDLPLDTENNFLENTEKRVVFGPNGRYEKNFVVRNFRLQPGVVSPPHEHPWTHLIVGLNGKGAFIIDGEVAKVEPGDWCYVPGDITHYFRNEGDDVWEFQCIVPPEGDVNPLKQGK